MVDRKILLFMLMLCSGLIAIGGYVVIISPKGTVPGNQPEVIVDVLGGGDGALDQPGDGDDLPAPQDKDNAGGQYSPVEDTPQQAGTTEDLDALSDDSLLAESNADPSTDTVVGAKQDTVIEEQQTDLTPNPGKATIVFNVVGPNQSAVSGVDISLSSQRATLENNRITRNETQSVIGSTDSRGILEAVNIEPGDYSVRAIPPQGFEYRLTQGLEVSVAEGDIANVLFQLSGGDPLPGLVVDEEGNPVEEAQVVAINGADHQVIYTNSDGRFKIVGIPEGQMIDRLTVSHPDYLSETRSDIPAMEGNQRITLKKNNFMDLVVLWEIDEMPVVSYRYRLFRRHDSGRFVIQESLQDTVNNPDGRTTLQSLIPGEWRVEVTVLDSNKGATTLMTAQEFTVRSGEVGKEVVALVSGGAFISGVVMNGENGGPADGATVSFVQPSAGSNRIIRSDVFHYPSTITDEAGWFQFDGMPPGRYSLTATKGSVRTLEAVDIDIPFEGEAEPIEIILEQGGMIYGTVTDAEGNVVSGHDISVSVQAPNADGWGWSNVTTEANGEYRVEGLPAGSHYLWVSDPAGGDRESYTIDLGPGEEKERNFDFSDKVTLSGRITMNGASPSDYTANPAFSMIKNGNAVENIVLRGGDDYEAKIDPGVYTLEPMIRDLSGVYGPFTISEEPKSQSMDFNLETATVEVGLVFPGDDQFAPGQMILSPKESGRRYRFIRRNLEQENRVLLDVLGGEYQATFASRDNLWHGESDWQQVGQNSENIFLIEVEKVTEKNRVGGWVSGQLSNSEVRTLTFDVTEAINDDGNVEVLVQYETGRHAAKPKGVRMKANGSVVQQDIHEGWTGADNFKNIYHLNNISYRQGSSYTLEVDIVTDGGTDSVGSVYMTSK